MSKAIISKAAEADMQEAYNWYAAKDADLALQFMLCVRETVDAIEKAPLRFPVAVADIRKAPLTKKFPYGIWYVTDGDSVVIACIHSRRDPSIAMRRRRSIEPQ